MELRLEKLTKQLAMGTRAKLGLAAFCRKSLLEYYRVLHSAAASGFIWPSWVLEKSHVEIKPGCQVSK